MLNQNQVLLQNMYQLLLEVHIIYNVNNINNQFMLYAGNTLLCLLSSLLINTQSANIFW